MSAAASGPSRCFIDLADHEPAELRRILDTAAALKAARAGLPQGAPDPQAMARERVLALVFEQPSTRTRVSFDVGMRQMGGETLFLSGEELQLGRGETVADTARVLSRYVDAIMVRTLSHDDLIDLAEAADVPVINGLTKKSHPCQILADVMTFEERVGPIAGRTVAWFGDSNNVSTSWIQAAALFGFRFRFAGPREFHPPADLVAWARERGAEIELTHDPEAAAEGADCLVTDTWVSLGDSKTSARLTKLSPYQVTSQLMERAGEGAIFMHCLPAHRGQEVTAAVMDGPASAVWDEAENRLHAQKGILAWCFGAV